LLVTGARACLTGATEGATVTGAACTFATSVFETLTPTFAADPPLANAVLGIAVTALGATMFAYVRFTVTLVVLFTYTVLYTFVI
jgi:hypothetical protein